MDRPTTILGEIPRDGDYMKMPAVIGKYPATQDTAFALGILREFGPVSTAGIQVLRKLQTIHGHNGWKPCTEFPPELSEEEQEIADRKSVV